MKRSESDALLIFENLFKASEKGLLPIYVFDEALTIYKELIEVRDSLYKLETSFQVAQKKFKHELAKEEFFL